MIGKLDLDDGTGGAQPFDARGRITEEFLTGEIDVHRHRSSFTRPHPEEPAQRASRRMGRPMLRDAHFRALLSMRPIELLIMLKGRRSCKLRGVTSARSSAYRAARTRCNESQAAPGPRTPGSNRPAPCTAPRR